MRVYTIPPPHQSLGLQRIGDALAEHAPEWVQQVTDWREADVVVLHVVGRLDAVMRQVAEIRAAGKRYAVVQYAFRSTQKPETALWRPLWDGAVAVWSTYRLETDRLYHAPFGVSAEFQAAATAVPPVERRWAVATSGFSWLTESVRECALAVRVTGGRVLHVGPEMHRDWVDCVSGIEDRMLSMFYRDSAYVSGLRRIEGFELPAAEGLVCGARPICFDRLHYRDWYGGWAEYVEEGTRDEVVAALTALLDRPYRTVTDSERRAAAARFDWSALVPTFYGRMVSVGHSSAVRVQPQSRARPRLPQGRRA